MKLFNVGIKGIIEKDGKIFIAKSPGEHGYWEFPGGRIDDDESIEQALTRELNEEVPGIQNIKLHELVYADRIPRDIAPDVSLVLLFYRVTADIPKDLQISDEHQEYTWATRKEALALTTESTKSAIEALK